MNVINVYGYFKISFSFKILCSMHYIFSSAKSLQMSKRIAGQPSSDGQRGLVTVNSLVLADQLTDRAPNELPN